MYVQENIGISELKEFIVNDEKYYYSVSIGYDDTIKADIILLFKYDEKTGKYSLDNPEIKKLYELYTKYDSNV